MRELLATELSPLVGRQSELAALGATLAEARLVSITGPGGVGKTRLALAVIDGAPGDAVKSSLAAVTEPELLVGAVIDAAGIRPEPGIDELATLTAGLAGREAVVLLDNCEQLREATAELCAELLGAVADLRLLVTSRMALGIPGEVTFELPPLSLGADGDAVALFLDRAHRASRGFSTDARTREHIAELCHDLDGLPLAVELAAARTRFLSVEQIATDLARRLDLLADGGANVPRHRSLRTSMEWSYELLSPAERAMFERVAVFAGGWDLEGAEAVCEGAPVERSAVLDLLGSLVDHSLVAFDADGSRFTMLTTIHAFAHERLTAGDHESLRGAHAEWCADVAEEAERRLMGDQQAYGLTALDSETENVRAALAFSRDAEPELALRIASACAVHWHARGRLSEGRDELERVIPHARSARTELRARVLWGLGLMLVAAGEFADARPVVKEALGRARETSDPALEARALTLFAELDLMTDTTAAAERLPEAVALARRAGDQWCLADALGKLGASALYRGDATGATAPFMESLAIGRAAGDERAVHRALGGLARAAALNGDVEAALDLIGEGLAIARRLGDRSWLALDLAMLGDLERAVGRPEQGMEHARMGMALAEEIDARYPRYVATGLAGRIALALGDLDTAASLFATAVALSGESGLVPFASAWHLGLAEVALARGDGDTAADAARSALARAEPIGHRADAARAMAVLGAVALERSNTEVAVRQLARALAEQREIGDRRQMQRTLEWLLRAYRAGAQAELAGRISEALGRDQSGLDDAVALALRGRGQRRREREEGWGGLTRAEAEVAELAASGLTNPQIGEQLFMSRTTVKRHLSRVFAQLGVTSRTELARVLEGIKRT